MHDWTRRRAQHVLEVIDGAIVNGFLPAAPREDGCKNCEFLPVCGPYEEERVREKSQAGIEGIEGIAGVEMRLAATTLPDGRGSDGSFRSRTQLGGGGVRRDGQDHGAGGAHREVIAAGTPVETSSPSPSPTPPPAT